MTTRRALLLAATFAFVVAANGAWAHAVALSADPPDGAHLPAAPARVTLRFNEPVAAAHAMLVDQDGARRELVREQATDGDDTLRLALPPLRDGRYLVSYRLTSADGHPVGGAIAFSVGNAAGSSLAAPAGSALREGPIVAAHIVHDIAWTVAMGVLAYLLLVAPWGHARLAVVVACVVTCGASLMSAGLYGSALTDADAGLLSAAAWRTGLWSAHGACLLAEAAGSLLAVRAIARSIAWRRSCAVIAIVLLCAGPLMTGHVATMHPVWFATPAMAMHVLAAAFWLGSLLSLGVCMYGADAGIEVRKALLRFAALATYAVSVLVLTGVGMAVVELDDPRELVDTRYGLLLLGKIALLACLLGIAAINRWRHTTPYVAGSTRAAIALRRNILVELALGMLAVAVAATLASTSPARQAVMPSAVVPVEILLTNDDKRVNITTAQSSHGVLDLRLQFSTAGGAAFVPDEVELQLELTSAQAGPMVRKAVQLSPGVFHWRGTELVPGTWTLFVLARRGEFEEFTFSAPIDVSR